MLSASHHGRRAGRLGAPAALAMLVLLSLAAVPAQGSEPKPKSGCWGRCGGDAGPVGGYFTVTGGKVEEFAYANSCLGVLKESLAKQVELSDYAVSPPKVSKLAIKHDTFSFKGDAFTPVEGPTLTYTQTPIEMKGRFVSATEALVTLEIHYGSCGTKHLTIHFR